MKSFLYNEMKSDIERCNNYNDVKGSQELFNQMITKYSLYDKDFSKNIQFLSKIGIPGKPLDYRKELRNIATKLNYYIQNDPIEECMPSNDSFSDILNKIFLNFIEASESLSHRRQNKNNFNIEDEYDVQDLMNAFLISYFDDVRREEWTPSYAGGSARQDFILKHQKTVIEIKMTRDSMTEKSLCDEIIVDIFRYFHHPECENLYIFVYDKKHAIKNFKAIKNDLEEKHKNIHVFFAR